MRVKIKDDYYNAGKSGIYLGKIDYGQEWAIVVWDGDEDPTTFKLSGLIFLD